MTGPDIPVISFPTARAWESWIRKGTWSPKGVWLKLAKKGSAARSLTYDEALEVALCHGWIDGQKKAFDAAWWLQKFSPRGPRSIWSKNNRRKAEALISSGRMRPAGLAEVTRARSDGRWDAAYDSPASAGVPPDLKAELDRSRKAREFFATLNSVNRYAILFRLHNAKKPETRARRLFKFVQMLERGEKIHP